VPSEDFERDKVDRSTTAPVKKPTKNLPTREVASLRLIWIQHPNWAAMRSLRRQPYAHTKGRWIG